MTPRGALLAGGLAAGALAWAACGGSAPGPPAAAGGAEDDPEGVGRCSAARAFLAAEGFATRTEPDTLDDWRSGRRLAGCRITAAGLTGLDARATAVRFFERLRATPGWRRTPFPADAPGEGSLRFRRKGTDCVFNVYSGVTIGTAAEVEVNAAVRPGAGERRYNALVQCVPAVEPRGRGQSR